jgi:leader peptidase (prepilin peptidase)/N-methyltransferase
VLEAIFAGLFGLLIGSFLNVCIFRMPRDLSVVRPRSFCPQCERPIAWFDNIPVLTYLMLAGRCRHCRASIPWRYPLVELLTGSLFFLGAFALGPTAEAARFCAFSAILVALVFTDLEERILPDEFTLGGTLAGIAFAAVTPVQFSLFGLFLPDTWSLAAKSVVESALAALILASLLWAIAAGYHLARGREGLGFGDVKMVACIGAFLGLGPALMTIVVGSVLGTVAGLLYIWLAKKDSDTYELPFGSFLGGAALLVAMRIGPLAVWLGEL